MAFNITESTIELPYKFKQTHYDQGSNLRNMGDPNTGFSDADILDVINLGSPGELGEIKFYKERDYAEPDKIIFTLFNVETNLVLIRLFVILHEKRSYFRRDRETRGRVCPNLTLTLKITQDPNIKTYKWSGDYF